MRKKDKRTLFWFIGFVIIALLAAFIYGGSHGWFASKTFITETNSNTYNQPGVNPTPQTTAPQAEETPKYDFSGIFNIFKTDVTPANATNTTTTNQATCTDSDPQDDPYVMGKATMGDGLFFIDSCNSLYQVKEYFCSSSKLSVRSKTFDCLAGMGCTGGVCKTMCTNLINPHSQADCEGLPTTGQGAECKFYEGSGQETCLEAYVSYLP